MSKPAVPVLSFALVTSLCGAAAAGPQTTELAKLVASDAEADDEFGVEIGLSGDTAVIGAHHVSIGGQALVGAAYVFDRGPSGTWAEVVELTASDGDFNDKFGHFVDVSGDTVVVGAFNDDHLGGTDAGSAYVFERDQGGPGNWGEVVKLVASDAAATDWFGESVAIDGDTIVVGARLDDDAGSSSGAAYVFGRDQGGPGAWGEVAKLTASDAESGDNFGVNVALQGDRIVVGAWHEDLSTFVFQTGAAYVFDRDQGGPGAWGEVAKLVASDGAKDDNFGVSVAVWGDTVVVGAWEVDVADDLDAGAAYVFERDQGGPGAWGEVQKLIAASPDRNDRFGETVAVFGNLIVASAYQDDVSGTVDAGSAHVFQRGLGGAGSWGEVDHLVASDAADGDNLGIGMDVGPGTALIGSFRDDTTAGVDTGSVYEYGLPYFAEPYCTAGVSASGCRASLYALGVPSATAAGGFEVRASEVEGAKDGLFFFGANGRQASPWGSGTSYQCVVPPVSRAELLTGNGSTGNCDGFFSKDLNALWCPGCPKPQKNPGAGAVVQAQLWYRDPQNTSNQTTSLSDALEFILSP